MPFAEFMRRALYEPGLGYYERAPGRVGRAGDFYTSVGVGPVFGELLAFQFHAWLGEAGAPPADGPWTWVEAGAHDGRLAEDLLTWIDRFQPDWAPRIEYRIVEPSPAREAWQRARLARWGTRVRWTREWEPVRGVVFANELLDAFPVERLGWEASARRWFRWGVAWEGGRFGWCRLPAGPAEQAGLPELPPALLDHLPDGYVWEFSPAAEDWWRRAAAGLRQGWLVTLDYGRSGAELLAPERTRGSLRGYRQHRLVDDLLEEPGTADLTAHVNFTRIAAAGESAGLTTVECVEQRQFLTRILARTLERPEGFPGWTPARVRQFQTLTHPEHLGHSFRVLVQRRDRDETG